ATDSGAGIHSLPYRFNDSGTVGSWQASNTYVNNSLTPDTLYCFRVQYRDNLTNTGTESGEVCNYTLANQPSITSVTTSYNGSHSCEVNFSMGGNPVGIEYYIEETTGNAGGTDKNWTVWASETSYIDEVSPPHTQYCYRIRAKNQNGTSTPYSSQVCNITYNHVLEVETPKIYDKDYNEIITVKSGTRIYIKANVTDGDGATDISSVKITIKDNNSATIIDNVNMTEITSITNGYTYEYNYRVPPEATGTWTVEVTGTDLGNAQDTNITTFEAVSVKIRIRLVLNQTSAKTYIPGTGVRDFADMTNEYFSQPPSYYIASYTANSLYGVVFQNQHFLGLLTNKTASDFAIGMDLNYPNSIMFVVFTRGDWRAINNRISLINTGDFLYYPEPSFAFGLGDKYKMKMYLDYTDKDIMGNNRKILGGSNAIAIKNDGLSDENLALNISKG
ncbi:MAG: hypothetical protein KAS04_05575, partial [Candidatus Aenigmarchaeota archaeon]|nr:hypothetical protein [Candidatus Aenigmarchaeota archaeon]